MDKPRLGLFALLAFVGGSLALLAWRTNTDWLRYLLILAAACLLLPAAIYFVEAALTVIINGIREMRQAWYAPTLQLAAAVATMGPRQLEVMQAGGVLKMRTNWSDNRLNWFLVTPEIDIPMAWLYEYLELSEETFPAFPPQHGLSDNQERAYRRAFSKLMCNEDWGIATWARGNKAPEWLLPTMAAVWDVFGWEK